MADQFKRGDTGINTAEGQISGPRAARLGKQRLLDQQEYESKRQKIQEEYHRGALKIDDKFGGSATDQYEAMFKVRVGGHITAGGNKKLRKSWNCESTFAGDTKTLTGTGAGDGAPMRKDDRGAKIGCNCKSPRTIHLPRPVESKDAIKIVPNGPHYLEVHRL